MDFSLNPLCQTDTNTSTNMADTNLDPNFQFETEACSNMAESATNLSCQTIEASDSVVHHSALETYLSVKAWVIFDEIVHKVDSKSLDVVGGIIPAICHHKSIKLKCTQRLVDDVTVYATRIKSEFQKAKSSGVRCARQFKARINEQVWRCKVSADEFVKREDFERIAKEEEQHQADIIKTNEVTVDIKGSEGSVPDQSVAENLNDFNSTFFLVKGSVMLEHIDKSTKAFKPVHVNTVDLFNALCHSKSVEMKNTASIVDKLKARLSRTTSQLRSGSTGSWTSMRVRKKIMDRVWKLEVHVDNFDKMEDFKRICIEWEQHELETELESKYEDDVNADNVSGKHWPSSDTGSPEWETYHLQCAHRARHHTETYLYISRSAMLQAIQESEYPEVTLQDVSCIVFDATCREKSVVYTDRLEQQFFNYVKEMIYRWRKAKAKSNIGEQIFMKQLANDCSLWRCKVLVEEFGDLEQFHKACIEHEMFEDNQRRTEEADSELERETSHAEQNSETSLLSSTPNEETILLVYQSQVLQLVMKSQLPLDAENFDDITRKIFDAVCRSNGFDIIYTPRLAHQFGSYAAEMIKRFKHAKRQTESRLNMWVKQALQYRPWKCKVYAIEFPNTDHFHQAHKRMLQYEVDCSRVTDTHLLVEYGLSLDISQSNKHLSLQEKVPLLVDALCKSKDLTPNLSDYIKEQLRKLLKKIDWRMNTAAKQNIHRKRNQMRKYQEHPPYKCKVSSEDFDNTMDFEKVHRESKLYDLKEQSERHLKDMKRAARQKMAEEEKNQKILERRMKAKAYRAQLEEMMEEKKREELKERRAQRRKEKSLELKKKEEKRQKRKMKRLRAEWPHGCQYCDWRFEKNIQLRLHNTWHRDEICCWCGLSFWQDTWLREHLILHHNRKQRRCRCHTVWDRTLKRCQTSLENHICPSCRSSYEIYSKGEHDICMKNINCRIRKCCFCYESHMTLAALDCHKKICHPRKKRLNTFECKYCGKFMSDLHSFRQHVNRHEKKYMCYWLKQEPVAWSYTILKE